VSSIYELLAKRAFFVGKIIEANTANDMSTFTDDHWQIYGTVGVEANLALKRFE
jgi:hypothetical protein